MSVILFYSPFSQRSRDTESLMIAFKQQGHRVISLSQSTGAQIHDHVAKYGVETYTHILSGDHNWWYFFRHTRFLISFIRKNKVQVMYSHLEPANVVASIAQYFTKAKTYIVRHHVDEAKLRGFDRSWAYRLTYALAKKVIVVSDRAGKFMIEKEKTDPRKIIHINLAYEFDLYPKPDPEHVKSIRCGFEDHVTLLNVGRFTLHKRPRVVIEILKLLREQGVSARAILLGQGEEEGNLRKLIADAGLTDCVIMPGYVRNVLDYMAASDFLVHPSVLESSCVAVKEAALVHLPVIVSKGVGDFDEYMVNGENGFAVDEQDFAAKAAAIITQYRNRDMSSIKESLYKKITELFSIENVVGQYQKLNEA